VNASAFLKSTVKPSKKAITFKKTIARNNNYGNKSY